MGKRIIIGGTPPPSKILLTDPSTWPYSEENKLVIDASAIRRKNQKYRKDIDSILDGMRQRARKGDRLLAPYSDYLSGFHPARFHEFVTRCRYACGSILYHVGRQTKWKIWFTVPLVNKTKGVPGDELWEIWTKKNPGKTYDEFCQWAHEHEKLISDMVRHGAITF